MPQVATHTINHLQVSADQTDFIEYLDLSTFPVEYFAAAINDGGDLRIYRDDSAQECAREIVSFQKARGASMVFDGDSFMTAPTLGNVLTESTIRVESEDVLFDTSISTGYWFSQASGTLSTREIGCWISGQFLRLYVGGTSTIIANSAAIIAEYGSAIVSGYLALELNLSTGAYTLENKNGVWRSGTLTLGVARVDGILFRLGSRAVSDTPGATGGSFSMPSGAKIGDTKVYLSGTLVRNYVTAGGTTSTWAEIENSQDGTLQNANTDGSQWSANPATGEVHVKIPGTLSSSVDTVLQIHADGISSDYLVTDTYGRNAVFSDYSLVSHDGVTDSTGNNSSTVTGTFTTPGILGDGLGADGAGDNVEWPSTASIEEIFTGTGGTVSAWMRPDGVGAGTFGRLFQQYTGAGRTVGSWLNATNELTLYHDFTNGGSAIWQMGINALGSDSYVAWTYDADLTSTQATGYLDGVSQALTQDSTPASGTGISTASTDLFFANRFDGARSFDGMLDEFRIRKEILSATWIATEYANQNSPATFATTVAYSAPAIYELTLTADGITFDPRASVHVQYMGTGSLLWVNENGSNASIASTPNGGTVTFVEAVPLTLTLLDAATLLPVQGAIVRAEATGGGPLADGTVIASGTSDVSGEVTASLQYSADQAFTVKARRGTSTPLYKPGVAAGVVTSTGADVTVLLEGDE